MSRLVTSGFELQLASSTGTINSESERGGGSGSLAVANGTVTYQTAVKRSGNAAQLSDAANEYSYWTIPGSATGRSYYARTYLRKLATPTLNQTILWFYDTGFVNLLLQVLLMNDGTISVRNGASSVLATAPALSNGVWYRLEVLLNINAAAGANDAWEVRIDDKTIGSGLATLGTTAPFYLAIGAQGGAPGTSIYHDDIALNDDQGTDQNSWPGEGTVLWLPPVSDNALGTGWEGPQTTGADVTNLFDNVNNTPPLGVAHADTDANALKYVFNAASNATTNLDLNLQTLTAAGVPSASYVKLIQAVVRTGSSSATDTAGAVRLVSNPDQGTETSFTAFDNGVANTDGDLGAWWSYRGPIVYRPSMARGTATVIRVGKRTANVLVAMVSQLGAYIEYGPDRIRPIRPSSQAVQRSVSF